MAGKTGLFSRIFSGNAGKRAFDNPFFGLAHSGGTREDVPTLDYHLPVRRMTFSTVCD